VSEFFDQALFPVVLVAYLSHEFPITHKEAWMVKGAMIFIVALMNIRGINMVFFVSVVFTFIITTPLWIELGFQVNKVDPSIWLVIPPDVDIGLFFSTIIWLYGGWDNLGTLAGEVKDPQTTYPKGILFALCLNTLVYLVHVILVFI
jgi:amino acid transporter